MERAIYKDYASAICNTPEDSKTFNGFVIGTAIANKVKADLTEFFVEVLLKTEGEAEDFFEDYYTISQDIDPWAVNMRMIEFCSDSLLDEPDIRRKSLFPHCTIPTTVGGSDGILNFDFQDGEKPIKYRMKLDDAQEYGDWQETGVWEDISKGVYDIQAQDANGYVVEYEYHMDDPYILSLTPADCSAFGVSDGTITASAAGRTAPYTYSMDGEVYQETGLFENLAAGSYTVYVKDSLDEVTQNVCEVEQPEFTLGLVPTDCTTYGGSDGTITATAGGATAPYTYSLDGTTYQGSGVFENLAAGSYTVYAKDANDLVTQDVCVIGQPDEEE